MRPDCLRLRLDRDGAQLVPAALTEAQCKAIEHALADLPVDRPGVRIGYAPTLRAILGTDGAIGSIALGVIGLHARPVRAVLFDKTAARNWALGWHQDRTIVVEHRADVEGFGPWTVKTGLVQVEPPFAILERMATLRVHLDPVDDTNAPLRIAPGSHRTGRIAEVDIPSIVARLGECDCRAARGDIWIYATPVLHGSRAADPPKRRRVLQLDYSADELPAPLRWRGI
ncbi:MAG: phytanoyl-CoA dioxygenase family protein [Sphingomonas bacterium]|nr:phytanoyl-CoA dioxygenase family protein [Sphingomonas bacterium]